MNLEVEKRPERENSRMLQEFFFTTYSFHSCSIHTDRKYKVFSEF